MNGPPRRRLSLLLLGLLLLCLLALAVLRLTVFQAVADQGKQALDRQAIEKVLTDQAAAWNRGDLDGFMAGYAHTEDLTYFTPKTHKEGWDALAEHYRQNYQSKDRE